MQKSLRNIGAVVLVSVALTGCQSLSKQGSSTHGGEITGSISKQASADTGLIYAKKHFREANYGLAEKSFRKLVELRPSNGEAWLGLAASYDQLGLFSRSDRAYKQILKLVGPKPAILNNQGYSQLLRGNKRAARRLFRKAKTNGPGQCPH